MLIEGGGRGRGAPRRAGEVSAFEGGGGEAETQGAHGADVVEHEGGGGVRGVGW